MKVYRQLSEVSSAGARYVAIGTFDGVHVGHQRIIRGLVTEARSDSVESMVVTFDPHPRVVVNSEHPDLLTTLDERARVIAKLGVDALFAIPFNEQFSRLSAEAFVTDFLVRGLSTRRVFVGYNFRFGHGGAGNVDTLRQLGPKLAFDVRQFEPVALGEQVVSSTQIRTLLHEGKVEDAALLLGRPYRLGGKVARGEGRGRLLGFPTANVEAPHDCLRPAQGVYAVRAWYRCGNGKRQGPFLSVANVGRQPTFARPGELRPVRFEVHLTDFADDLYDCTLMVDFLSRLRAEKRFPDVSSLIEQLNRDVAQTVEKFGKNLVERQR